MSNKPNYPDVSKSLSFYPCYGKFDLTSYIQGASDYEIMCKLVELYNSISADYNKLIDSNKEVIDYINNLDFQEYANNKIDNMVASGQFQHIVAELGTWINVEILGFKGNGTEADTNILQTALNDFNNIVIPEGTYKLYKAIKIPSFRTIVGNNATFETNSNICFDCDGSVSVSISGVNLRHEFNLFTISDYDDVEGRITVKSQVYGERLKVGDVFTTSILTFANKPNLPIFKVTEVLTDGYKVEHEPYGEYTGFATTNYPAYCGNFSWGSKLVSANSTNILNLTNTKCFGNGYAIYAPNSEHLSINKCEFETALDIVLIGEANVNKYTFTFKDCKFRNYDYGKQGIVIWRDIETPQNGNVYNITVDGCTFEDISETGLSFSYYSNKVFNVSVQNCVFKQNFLHAISVVADNVSVRNCIFESKTDGYRTDVVNGFPLGATANPQTTNNSLSITNSSFINTRCISCGLNTGGAKPYVNVENCNFNNKNLRGNINVLSTIDFMNCTFNDSHTHSSINNKVLMYVQGVATFSNCVFKQVFNPYVVKDSVLKLNNCTLPNTTVSISETVLATFEAYNCSFASYNSYTNSRTIINGCTLAGDVMGDVYHSTGLHIVDGNWAYGTTKLPKLKITNAITVPNPTSYETTPSLASIGETGIKYGNHTLKYPIAQVVTAESNNVVLDQGFALNIGGFSIIMINAHTLSQIGANTNLINFHGKPTAGAYTLRGYARNSVDNTISTPAFNIVKGTTVVKNSAILAANVYFAITFLIPQD